VSRETLRKWMVKTSLWCPRAQRVKTIMCGGAASQFRELVMQDSSPFRWLEERGRLCQLIAVLDDATSRFYARFTEHDTTEENLRTFGNGCGATDVLWPITPIKIASSKGRPAATSRTTPGRCAANAVRASVARTGIEWIAAHSPQAKGRIERCLQRCRTAGKGNAPGRDRQHPAANHFLEMCFLPAWEQRSRWHLARRAMPTDG